MDETGMEATQEIFLELQTLTQDRQEWREVFSHWVDTHMPDPRISSSAPSSSSTQGNFLTHAVILRQMDQFGMEATQGSFLTLCGCGGAAADLAEHGC